MPIRWYGPADPADPTYRHFARIVNLCVHAAAFAAVNSGLWFVQELRHPWSHLAWLSGAWGLALGLHLLIVLALRPRRDAANASSSDQTDAKT
ncbi:MAG: 2TM domain-containing protein [Prochlorococcaceae cyanobacterium]